LNRLGDYAAELGALGLIAGHLAVARGIDVHDDVGGAASTDARNTELSISTAAKRHNRFGAGLAHKAGAGRSTVGELEQGGLGYDDAAHGVGDDVVLGECTAHGVGQGSEYFSTFAAESPRLVEAPPIAPMYLHDYALNSQLQNHSCALLKYLGGKLAEIGRSNCDEAEQCVLDALDAGLGELRCGFAHRADRLDIGLSAFLYAQADAVVLA
jgi:hypothetical protein